MSWKRRRGAGRLCLVVPVVLVVAACANPRPAPVVNRTNLPPGEAQSPYGTAPGQPPFGGPTVGSVDPNLKTAPKGFKRPYAEVAAADPSAPAISRGTSPGGPPAAPPASAAAVSPVAPPAVMTPTVPTPRSPPVATAVPAAPAGGSGGSGVLDGVAFGWPAAGGILQNFDQTSSKGLALGGKAGDAVRAAADGRVIFSGAGPRGYGNLIIVKHDNELLSVYAHNRTLTVKEGESVKRGQKIAELGASGTDAPKLHFEIRQQGRPIDPLAVLPRR